nr:MAG TPA: hypothetical protein [Caudoviricetes sp.]
MLNLLLKKVNPNSYLKEHYQDLTIHYHPQRPVYIAVYQANTE